MQIKNNMNHKMSLRNKPFNNIKSGTKTIELRLYDEKTKYELYIKYYQDTFNKNISEQANKTILKILSLNIQQGNTLTGLNNKNEDIIIHE